MCNTLLIKARCSILAVYTIYTIHTFSPTFSIHQVAYRIVYMVFSCLLFCRHNQQNYKLRLFNFFARQGAGELVESEKDCYHHHHSGKNTLISKLAGRVYTERKKEKVSCPNKVPNLGIKFPDSVEDPANVHLILGKESMRVYIYGA